MIVSTSHRVCTMKNIDFAVLGSIRKQELNKLAHMPLGDGQARGSGELKNILVERVDSIEPTLAHVIPEMSSNAVVVLVTLVYLFVLDWRMALTSLITFPLGMVFFILMMVGYDKNYACTVATTNTLNDTAVEYIGGIEVIKVFGKAKSSYEKFVSAAKECAQSYIDWMNKSNFYFTFAMNIMPATLLTVLPIGGLLLKNGTLTPDKFVLIVGDKCMGMLEAVGEVFPDAKYQRCTVHFYRNVFSVVPKSKVKIVAKMLKAIHAQESKKASREKAKAVVSELRAMKLKEAAKKVEDGIEETLTYCDFPGEHWTRIRTNNVIERLNREIRRRTRVVGTFPDGNSALMLVCARLRHVAGTQWGNKKYMNTKHLEAALDDVSIAG